MTTSPTASRSRRSSTASRAWASSGWRGAAGEAITLALELEPDIVLADVRMGGGGGAGVARELSRAGLRSRVIGLSAYDDHPTVMQMFDAGAAAYLLKGSTIETLIEGISRAAQGLQAVGDAIAPVSRRGRNGAQRTRRGRTAVVTEPTGVLLVDDNQDLLRELIAVVEAEPGFEVVGSTSRAAEAAGLATLCQPRVAMIDWRMPGGGIDIVGSIRERSPMTRVVGMSMLRHPQIVMAMLRAGASGFIAKPVRPDELVASLQAAADGQMSLTPELSGPVLEQLVVDIQDLERAADERTIMRERGQALMHGPLAMAYQPIVALVRRALAAR